MDDIENQNEDSLTVIIDGYPKLILQKELTDYSNTERANILFETAKYNAKKAAEKYADDIINMLISGVSEQRQKAWPVKGRIAADIIKGNALEAEIATVQTEINERGDGLTVPQLAKIHLEKSVALLSVNNIIEGMIFKLNNAVDATSSPEELEAIIAQFSQDANARRNQILTVFNS